MKDVKYVLIYKDLSLIHYKTFFKDLNDLRKILSDNTEPVEALVLFDVYPGDYDLQNVENIYFVFHAGEMWNIVPPISKNFNKYQNFYIHFAYASQRWVDYYSKYLPCNVKVICSAIGFYGLVDPPKINYADIKFNNQDLSKHKMLKQCNNILWNGKIHADRARDLNLIQDIGMYSIKHLKPNIDLNKCKMIDLLLDNDCFCSLSLDGTSATCYRDTEYGVSNVFNLKYTTLHPSVDISAAKGIYLCHNVKEFNNCVTQIKEDINNENYQKLYTTNKYMENLFIINKLSLTSNIRVYRYELLYYILGKNINNAILHPDINENSTAEQVEGIFNEILNENTNN